MSAEILSLLWRAAIVGSVVSIGALLANRLLSRSAPTLRSLLLLVALGSFAAAPVLSHLLPIVNVPGRIPQAFAAAARGPETPQTGLASPSAGPSFPSHTAGGGAATLPVSRSMPKVGWRDLLVGIWALGSALLWLRMGLAFIALRRIVRRASPLDGPSQERVDQLAATSCPGRTIRCVQSPFCSVPMTLGVLQPVVMLPPRVARDRTTAFDAIVTHELAHVRRRDVLVARAAYLVSSLVWFVPFAWMDLSRLRLEQEKACDQEALRASQSRTGYAELLMRVRASASRLSVAAALSAPMTGLRAIEDRIRAILRQPRQGTRHPRLVRTFLALGAMCVLVPLSMVRCAPAPAAQSATTVAAPTAEPEVRFQLQWKSGQKTMAPDASVAWHDFPTLWPIESRSGARRGVVTLGYKASTAGIDIAGTAGWPVVAAGNGTVVAVGADPIDGNFVAIRHPSGFESRYSHLREPSLVGGGTVVEMGQKIGALGNTGKSTSPHLQFSLSLNGTEVDPEEILGMEVKAVAINVYSSLPPALLRTTTQMSGDSFQPVNIDTIMTAEESVLLWPLKGKVGFVTTAFGPAVNPFTKKAFFHRGIDIAWADGTTVVAATAGTVRETGNSADTGNYVRMESADGIGTSYAHLGTVSVSSGEVVTEGQKIGTVGMTGQTTGPHLHFEATYQGRLFDPLWPPTPREMPADAVRGVP